MQVTPRSCRWCGGSLRGRASRPRRGWGEDELGLVHSGSELDVGRRLLPCSWVIAASVLFFPLLPSSGLRSRQKCMSQRYMVPAREQALEVWWGREAFGVQHLGCRLPGIPACLGGHWQGPGHCSRLASPLFPIPVSLLRPQPRPVRVGQSCQEEAAGGESTQAPKAWSCPPSLTRPRPYDGSPFL